MSILILNFMLLGMRRTKWIQVRVSDDEKRRFDALAQEANKPLGLVVREALEKMAARVRSEADDAST